jgi:hypothetical protein
MRKIFIFSVSAFFAFLSFAFSQAAKDNADEILKKMSDKLASAKTFTFSTSEVHTRVKLSGEKNDVRLEREALVRRPNGIRYTFKGGREWSIWYDGKYLTAVSDKEKGFIQTSTPPTIDETLDEVADRFDINMPVSDLIYSSPYDSFTSSNSKGGVVGTQSVEGKLCDHLVYKTDAVDWELWVGKNDSLPYELVLNYKDDVRNPRQQIIFKNWNLNAEATDKDFAFNIPQGYQRIPIMEKIRLVESSQTQTQPK